MSVSSLLLLATHFLSNALPLLPNVLLTSRSMLGALLSRVLLLVALVAAQDSTSIVYPTTAAPSATIVPGLNNYEYAGCWNETTGIPNSGGLRALNGGNAVSWNRSSHINISAACADSGLNIADDQQRHDHRRMPRLL